MKTVVPMRRPNSTLHKNQNNVSFLKEFEFPFGVTLSVLSWIVFSIYFGVIILGVFAVVLITGIGIGSFKHSRQPSLVQSCVPASEFQLTETQDRVSKAA
jgi:apolipoprotein N-acyltransferase